MRGDRVLPVGAGSWDVLISGDRRGLRGVSGVGEGWGGRGDDRPISITHQMREVCESLYDTRYFTVLV